MKEKEEVICSLEVTRKEQLGMVKVHVLNALKYCEKFQEKSIEFAKLR